VGAEDSEAGWGLVTPALMRSTSLIALSMERQGYGRLRTCAIFPATQDDMLAANSIGQILAVLLTLNLIGLSFVAYRILRRK
jgi:hypothetical protein